ncbi:MAG: RluA family pseudouridine synthase [Oscillospiraceae bacterium]|nr:RluA family pseudouridine synthase [Oscillospiraceae bacterium]
MNEEATVPEILFEDNHLLVAVKPAGILSQADATGTPDMLTILKADLKRRYNKPGDVYLGLLHRLDRPVRGVMVFARTSKCASRISAQIRERTIEKKYRAIVCGSVSPPAGTLRGAILKDSKNNRSTVFESDSAPEEAKECVLLFESTSHARYSSGGSLMPLTLLDITLVTGRSHQIRAQLSDAGYPILGDKKYGDESDYRGDICLESYSLTLRHPIRNEKMNFNIPLPGREPWLLFEKGTENGRETNDFSR